MQLSTEGLELIKRSEGFRSRQYLDVAGFATIGYGHRVAPPESFPGAITEEQATAMLMNDVRLAERAVSRLVHVALTQGQFDALIDFCFNMGAGRLASSTLLKHLNASQYESAGQQLLRWDCAGSEPNAGLRARREAELQLWTGCRLLPLTSESLDERLSSHPKSGQEATRPGDILARLPDRSASFQHKPPDRG
jgi:lysozyme